MFVGHFSEKIFRPQLRHTRDVSSADYLDKLDCSMSSTTEQQQHERVILQEFYNHTNGTGWFHNHNWTKPISHCCWYGVVCNLTTGLVNEIDLDFNNLTGHLPSSIFKLSSLGTLILRHNRLTGKLEDILLPNVTLLYKLDLSYNSFSGTIPWDVLSTYRSLGRIELAGSSKLQGQIKESLAKLENLEVISLGYTNVCGRVPDAIKSLKKLWFLDFEMLGLDGNISFLVELPSIQYVHLQHNNLVGQLPHDLGTKLIHLVELHLAHNSLEGKFPDSFHMTVNLIVVNIASNQFHGPVPLSVLQSKNLLYLDVSSNKFDSLPSNLTLPSIQFLILANNPFLMTPDELIKTLLHMKNRTNVRILDISSCGFTGLLPTNIWLFTNIMVLKIANNSFYGIIPSPIVKMYYLIAADFSNNSFSGPIPEGFFLMDAIQTFDLRNNTQLTSSSVDGRVPWFIKPDYTAKVREVPNDTFTCPIIRFNNTEAGILLINSSYYGGRYCECDPGYYGHSGLCHKCPTRGYCSGGSTRSVVKVPTNYYPSPSPSNMTALVQCSHFYQDTFRCNPNGNCICWLSSNGTTTECDNSSICAHNSTGRLCSKCTPNFYKYSDICLPCSNDSSTKAVVGFVITVLALLIIMWLLSRIRPRCISLTAMKAFNIGAIVFQTGLVLSLGISELIPTYVAELYILMVVLALFDHLTNVKVFALILLVYFQVLSSLNIFSQSVTCQHCSFADLLQKCGMTKVVRAVNFHFSGVTCLFPFLSTPIGRLAALAAAPLVLALMLFLGRLIDHYMLVRLCMRKNGAQIEELRQTMANNSKSNIVFLLNVFYYPIAHDSITALLPCEEAEGDIGHYMRVYPWISCSSQQYLNLIILAGIVTAIYICLIPVFFLVLLRYYTPRRPGMDEAIKICSQSKKLNEEEEGAVACAWLHCLQSGFKSKYQTWISVGLMLRRLVLAVVLTSFKNDQADAQSFVLTTFLIVSITFIAVTRPYRNTTSWQLESAADVGAFSIILVTYNGMSSRRNVSPTTTVCVFSLNVTFIMAMVIVAISQLLYVCWGKWNKGRKVTGRIGHYTELPGDNRPEDIDEHSFSTSISAPPTEST